MITVSADQLVEGSDRRMYFEGSRFTGISKNPRHRQTTWYADGEIHREDGPAIMYENGDHMFWLHDLYYSSIEEWAQELGIYDTPKFLQIKIWLSVS